MIFRPGNIKWKVDEILLTYCRFAVSPRCHNFELNELEAEIMGVQFIPGLDNSDKNTRNGFRSLSAQSDWLLRVAKKVFDCVVTAPEAKGVLTCLRKSSEDEISLHEIDSYLVWPRVLSIAVKTVPLVGSKSAGGSQRCLAC